MMILIVAASIIVACTASREPMFSGRPRENQDSFDTCGMFLIPSTLPGAGRGVVAGINFNVSDRIEIIPTITISVETMDACQLKNYGFGTGHNDFTLIIYGPGNIYNHRKPHTLGRFWAYEEDENKDPTMPTFPYTDFKRVLYNVRLPIKVGEEMYETYGDHWFARFSGGAKDRKVQEAVREAMVMDMGDMIQYGHCLTDVRVKPSGIAGAGNGLFAARDFEAGEVVTISPALTLPRYVVDGSESNSVLKNYCFATPGSDLVLFPLNYGPMINHDSTSDANVRIDWYDWSPAVEALAAKYRLPGDPELDRDHNLKLNDKLERTVSDLFNSPFAQLDIAYKATAPIRKGEELFLNYGKEWEDAWNAYSAKAAAWEAQQQSEVAAGIPKPQFRQYMSIPEGMYPAQWMKQADTQCGLFLIPSTIPGAGRGVVAGRAFYKAEHVENVPTITVTASAAHHSQLKNYVFGTGHDDFNLIIFGPGNIYNHRKPHTLGRYGGSPDKDPTKAPLPYTDFTKILYATLTDIETGEEMYETYGDHWFNRFNKEKKETSAPRAVQESTHEAARLNVSDMLEYGHCLTDIRVEQSGVAGAGLGLFAARDFAPGEVVTISPVLSLPKSIVESSSVDTVLMNYCLASPDSELVLFPINYGPMINHNTTGHANVEVGWYDWSPAVEALAAKYRREGDPEPDAGHSLRLADKLAMSVQELFDAPFAQLDIAYRATRAIKQGEELFLDYGADWQAAWEQYASNMAAWEAQRSANGAGDALKSQKPQFRHFLAVPPSLYSAQWYRSGSSRDKSEL